MPYAIIVRTIQQEGHDDYDEHFDVLLFNAETEAQAWCDKNPPTKTQYTETHYFLMNATVI